MPLTPQLESRRSAEMQMLLLLPLLWLGRSVLGELVDLEEMGELGELGAEEELDLSDFDLDIARLRLPRQVKTILSKENKPHIQELSIKTTIISRYAFTVVNCVMVNRHTAAADGLFRFRVPANALVSNFTMLIGGRVYQSEVKPRERRGRGGKGGGAKSKNKAPDDASGASDPEVELFQMNASIPGNGRAVFLLSYEELLQRRLGRYEHVTSLRPLQLVRSLRLEVALADHAPIANLQVLPLRSARSTSVTSSSSSSRASAKPQLPVATSIQQEGAVWRVTFNPSIIQQAKISTAGLLGDFVIRYDVQRDASVGDVQVLGGHFVHYFAPSNLPPVPKNVVFLIDTSASMLGKKIRQTKDALLAILMDLRPADRFNLVGFSSRVKVWQPSRMVAATPLNIRDAKKFIFTLPTTGGTDIDGALQAGSALLRDFLSASGGGGTEPGGAGVSLLLFLTDGRPTTGKLQSAAILEGSRSAASAGRFCIFTVGVGGDVDHGLLRRLALDNCGAMRRVPDEADLSAALKGFYDEIGTPLLSDVRLSYGEDSALAVTQSAFATCFNGSEVVVAGRLANRSAESLHVTVTGSSGARSVVLEADVPLRRRQAETHRSAKAVAAVGGVNVSPGGPAPSPAPLHFAEHVWAFLSVQERLRWRLSTRTSRERAELVGRASQLARRYHFLTPLTSLQVERPQVLADGTMAPAQHQQDNRLPGGEEEEEKEEPIRKPGGQRSPVAGTAAGEVKKKTAKKSVTISKTSADGDPHFVVEFPLSKLNVCFNINGEPGHVLRLVSDHHHSGVTVNGKLIGAPAPPGSHKQQRTYFGSVTIVADRPPRRAYIEVTPRKVILDGRDRLVLPCHATAAVDSGDLSVAVVGGANVTVMLAGANVTFVVLLHHYKNPAPYQRDHLGFYIAQSKGLSPQTHGLLGQFLYEEVGVAEAPGGDRAQPTTVLKVKERSVAVVKKTRRIYGGAHSVDCWFARNNAAKLIDGRYEDYLAPHMFDTGDGRRGGGATNGA